MRHLVELSRDLTFSEASARCRANPELLIRRTDGGTGFSVWASREELAPVPQAISIPTPQTARTTETPTAARAALTPSAARASARQPQQRSYSPVPCHRCGARGRLPSGDICTYCDGAGKVKYEPPSVPHSDSNPIFETLTRAPDIYEARRRDLEHRRGSLAKRTDGAAVESTASGTVFCYQCNGDGGAGGKCPRCGGNGFEPMQAP
jgi:hypothetical protein